MKKRCLMLVVLALVLINLTGCTRARETVAYVSAYYDSEDKSVVVINKTGDEINKVEVTANIDVEGYESVKSVIVLEDVRWSSRASISRNAPDYVYDAEAEEITVTIVEVQAYDEVLETWIIALILLVLLVIFLKS